MSVETERLTLSNVEAQFVEWRQNRDNPHTPQALKRQAVALLGVCSQNQILKRLKINHAMLKRWQRQLGTELSAMPAFVALPSAPPPASAPDAVDNEVLASVRLKVTRQCPNGEVITLEGELSSAQWRWALDLLSERVR